jgi:hypothetical protein
MLTRLLSNREIEEDEDPPMPIEIPIPWDEMVNQMIREAVDIKNQVWRFLRKNPEEEERWIRSKVTQELFRILGESNLKGRWTKNPYIAILRFHFMISQLPMIGSEEWAKAVDDWVWKFKIWNLEPKPTAEEFRMRDLY